MRPHPNHFDHLDVVKNLVDKPMLDVDAPRANTGQIADESLVRRGCLVRVGLEDLDQSFCLRSKARACELLGVSPSLGREDQSPAHQPGFLWHFFTVVLRPRRMDAFIPGIEVRYSVS